MSKFTSLSIKEQDKSNTVKFYVDKAKGVTICRLYDRWNDRYFTAKTTCLDVDKFSEKTGRAIAFNKARRKELLSDIRNLEQLRDLVVKEYENLLKSIDHRQGLKHIYLAGVDEELTELMKR